MPKHRLFSIMNKLILAVACLIAVSCVNPQQKLRNEIQVMEGALFSDSSMVPNKEKAAELVKKYVAYADKYKEDTLSAEFLFKAGDLSNNLKQFKAAIDYLGRAQKYKGFEKAPLALFLQGFIAETSLNDLDQAKQYYESFLLKYPDHQLANDVLSSLGNLGKTPEELVLEFEANKKMQDSTAAK